MITPKQKRQSLIYVNLFKEKWCGKINGRPCTDGSTQRGYISREDASLPTISLEALIYTFAVDSYWGHDVAIIDVTGDYLNTNMPNEKYARLKLEGEFVDIMWNVNTYHIPNIRYENGYKVIYLKILKALNGCIEPYILWYDLYVNTLK